MNGDDKEEAHRPRPLSAGIWTLFSWLRRSERSSSSESLSSVGSARTAVSFDFLAPGHCKFTKTPVVLTSPLGPPTETYKKRLQDRNLRRQRDRDITLHRKYGLYREYGTGYDGYSLPPTRRELALSVDRQNRERRATSECLQRRAAYVPGKRRAPLPPVLLTSASLPRSYKRKRPAPKPPVTKTIELEVEKQISNSGRMSSSLRSEGGKGLVPDIEVLISSKTEEYDKKSTSTSSKDSKPRAEKSFLKSIFENKRKSTTDTATVRLLPSISELDKQAAEIIENNKFRQSRNYDNEENAQSSNSPYEGNTWFCTSCLRKYDSSINSCSYCYREKTALTIDVKKHEITKNSRPRSSNYTQTNSIETSSSSRNCSDERKILKEILKEMKDSLPKKHRENRTKVNDVVTETEIPTLRIGSTVYEKFKDLTPQPSSSREFSHNVIKENTEKTSTKILSDSSALSETAKKLDQRGKKNDDHQTPNTSKHLTTLVNDSHEDKNNIQSPFLDSSANIPEIDSFHNQFEESGNSGANSPHLTGINKHSSGKLDTNKIDTKKVQERKNTLISEEKDATSPSPKLLPDLKIKDASRQKKIVINTNEGKKTSSDKHNNSVIPYMSTELVKNSNTNSSFHYVSKINNVNNTSDIMDKKASKNECTDKNGSTPDNTKKHFTSKEDTKKTVQKNEGFRENINVTDRTQLKTETYVVNSSESSINCIPFSYLHTPLKISTLLNPLYSPKLPVINVDSVNPGKKVKIFQNIDEKQFYEKNVNQSLTKQSLKSAQSGNDLIATSQIKEAERIITSVETERVSEKLCNQSAPSTSRSSNSVTMSTNKDIENLDHYDRRRHLINQLEQSIAKGDEAAAADAAIKLAKLKLSCSVLSFSSQIVGEPLTKNETICDENLEHVSKSQLNTGKQPEITIYQTLQNHAVTNVREIKNVNNGAKATDVDCNERQNVEPSSSNREFADDIVPIDVWIEDKQAARGPIRLRIPRRASMADLRRQAELSLGLATNLQRWIIGRTLCTDDATLVVSLAGPDLKAPFYLCVVQSETNNIANIKHIEINHDKDGERNQNNEFYIELVKLEHQSLVANVEPFECGVCMEECAVGAGVVLRECIHTFCRECLSDVVQHCQEPAVSCPAMGCSGFLQEREIRTIVSPDEYERWLARSLATAECGTRNAFHCRTRDCTGWAFCDPGVRRFPCPVCKHTNCVQCKAIHEGETCEQYQVKLRETVTAPEIYKDDEGTQALLNSLISRGEALECPECRAIITKKWGCDWVKCSACKTEICWVTKGRRWGPGGRGDTSGGCRCGVDGQRCHPSCGYCH